MRLGLDLGTNSIGWWLYATQNGAPVSVVDGGVRIFSDGRDPQLKVPLAVDRRIARGQRRRRDRFLRRKAALMKRMATAGLMPADPKEAKELELLTHMSYVQMGSINLFPSRILDVHYFISISGAVLNQIERRTVAITKAAK